MVATTAKASGLNIFPSISPSVKMGRNTMAMTATAKTMGRPTSCAALRMACSLSSFVAGLPAAVWSFSTMMMVASMIMPNAMAIPPKEMRSPGRPARSIRMIPNRIAKGSDPTMIMALRIFPRNRNATTDTRMKPSTSALRTVRMLLETNSDWS